MVSAMPDEVSIALVITTTYGAFMAGFGIDSRLNKFTKTKSVSFEDRRADEIN
jgi:hypothetical protein